MTFRGKTQDRTHGDPRYAGKRTSWVTSGLGERQRDTAHRLSHTLFHSLSDCQTWLIQPLGAWISSGVRRLKRDHAQQVGERVLAVSLRDEGKLWGEGGDVGARSICASASRPNTARAASLIGSSSLSMVLSRGVRHA